MRLFIDECLSPEIARRLNGTGLHLAEHPLDFGGRGAPDYRVLQRCIERGLVIVTENAFDFSALVGAEEIHPGLIVLPCVGRERSFALLQAAIDFLESMDDEAMDVMINHVIEVDVEGAIRFFPLSFGLAPSLFSGTREHQETHPHRR